MKTLLLTLLLFQAEETIQRADKKVYLNAARECERATGLIKSSPSEAVEILTAILETEDIRKRECILRIELMPGTHSRKYHFFPHQIRGKALMQLAKLSVDNESAIDLLKRAREDFKKSIRLGLPSSKGLLEQVKKEISLRSKVEEPVTPKFPEAEFLPNWESLILNGKFKAALAYVNGRGSSLPKERRDFYRAETRRKSSRAISEAVHSFQSNLENNPEMVAIAGMKSFVFDRKFALPEKGNLPEHPKNYLWSLSVRDTLSRFRKGKEILDDLFRLALEAVRLEPNSNNTRFQSMENFAGTMLGKKITSLSEAARNAPLAERNAFKEKVSALQKKWTTFETDVAKATRNRTNPLTRVPSPDLEAPFPEDWDGAPDLSSKLIGSAREEAPDLALRRIAEELSSLRKKWGIWSIESRRSILRFQIAVGTLRGYLSEKSLPQITKDLRDLGNQLKKLNGQFDGKEFGPKVQSVFAALGKS